VCTPVGEGSEWDCHCQFSSSEVEDSGAYCNDCIYSGSAENLVQCGKDAECIGHDNPNQYTCECSFGDPHAWPYCHTAIEANATANVWPRLTSLRTPPSDLAAATGISVDELVLSPPAPHQDVTGDHAYGA
jgi:hypothetical protein